MRGVFCLVLATLATLAAACLNDRDTLAAEVDREPDVLWVIVGRFERNPPLYYEMRIERVARELKDHPDRLDLYDDISVAYDRLHQDDMALAWIDKKRPILSRLGMKGHEMDWYRYYANAGTFHAHRWFATRPTQTAELGEAEEYIAKAIHINPGAHFGREGYQLAAIRWTLNNLESQGEPLSFGDSIELHDEMASDESKGVEGLSGLIRLGGAWESPDIYDALAIALGKRYRTFLLSEQASLRRDELIAGGHKAASVSSRHGQIDSYEKQDKAEFKRLRADAEAWAKQRSDFMLAKLRQGKHPDTDPDFWSGYVERPKPDVWSPPFWETMDWGNRVVIPGIMLSPFAIGAFFAVRAIRRRLRKKKRSAAAS